MKLLSMTRLLADMQTRVNAAGLRCFDGDIDRFAIFSLITRESIRGGARNSGISTHSAAISLGRSFETVRRHVNALIAAGLCVRLHGGVVVNPEVLTRPDIARLIALTHDSFVCFVQALYDAGELPVLRPSAVRYDRTVGVQAAVDVMLATADSNQAIHGNWLDLVIFSTILAGNLHRAPLPPRRPVEGVRFGPDHAVRASVLARVLNLSETTVRRRLGRLGHAGGPVVRLRQGYIISSDWMKRPDAIETSQRTATSVRLAIAAAAAQGFPFDAPHTAYQVGPPPPIVF
ncbi:DeoR family transcriptional regulator [Sphingomonas sp. MA1305]|uniref:DeoR family transcriptional regulator n=1 Tax=Sphingomonas sp. MA1305 TaxID=2479204 RepID=UPI001E2FDC60|nr:DeoR family transcriptional regulator [Sphingomonas sp. MA1305]